MPPPEYDNLIDDIMSKFASDDSAMAFNNDDDDFNSPTAGIKKKNGNEKVRTSANIEVIELSDDDDDDAGVEIEPPKTTNAKSDQRK